MSELLFTREDYKKHGTFSIIINKIIKLKREDFRIINEFEETNYGYKKATIEFDPDLCIIMCDIQRKINQYLQRNKLSTITLIYKDRVYCKTHLEDGNEVSEIKIKSIWFNKDKKPFAQIFIN